MAVLRIVPNLPARDPAALARLRAEVLGLEQVMDLGFIVTLAGGGQRGALSLASEGGAGRGRRCPPSRSRWTISTRCWSGRGGWAVCPSMGRSMKNGACGGSFCAIPREIW